MNDNINNTENKNEKSKETATQDQTFTLEYVLKKIDTIRMDTEHIHEAINTIGKMQNNESVNGGFGDQAKAEAVAAAVQSRETTNQQLLKLYEKMYDDLKPQPQSPFKEKALAMAMTAMDNGCFDEFSSLLDTLRHS
ncbi:hypothetical protein SDC9_198247 [bioreactor metagenome]|uniref:Uncharacterized protein n=1 Tax=bioreactor metagenome TaxID=1076179 RepID=A0A645IHZ9_9ZZZZ|nr:hypothetical protein [Oscillospiraceae bacterium]